MGGLITRLAAINTRRKGTKIIYTAHGFHFYKGASIKNWIVFYPIEKVMARFCDILITITKEDYRLAYRKFRTNVIHMHGVGVYTERYHSVDLETSLAMRTAEGLQENEYVILCTGELNQNKNQKILISAAKILKKDIPNLKILFAGNGPLETTLRRQMIDLGLEESIQFLGYRTDLEKITPIVDLVVSCSYREGLPLNILEAMLCKKPVVASNNRGHRELVKNGCNGYIVEVDTVNDYADRIQKIYYNSDMAERMGEYGWSIAQAYTADSVKKELEKIYQFI